MLTTVPSTYKCLDSITPEHINIPVQMLLRVSENKSFSEILGNQFNHHKLLNKKLRLQKKNYIFASVLISILQILWQLQENRIIIMN